MKLGTVKNLGFDTEGYERRECLEAIAECPGCGRVIRLWSETEEWVIEDDGRRTHSSYGPATGICEKCNKLIADWFDGCFVYDLKTKW